MRIPIENQWTQPNTSDKFGSTWYTKNINFDEYGYAKLSPRMITVQNEATSANLGVPVGIGQYSSGGFQIGTTSNANYTMAISPTAFTVTEDTGTSNPTMTTNSHAKFWQDRWHASTDTAVLSKDSDGSDTATWTSRITGLTSGVRHYVEVHGGNQSLLVTNGNVLKQYNTSYTGTTDLTIDADFEMVGVSYNNGKVGIITKVGNNTTQRKEAMFFIWDGASDGNNGAWGVSADACLAIAPYKSSFVILTSAGQLKYFNGGGFQDIASFPFFYEDKKLDFSTTSYGDTMVADGDIIYINLGVSLNEFGRAEYSQMINCPSGVWCYDPPVGLYHRWSPSISKMYRVSVVDGGVSANVITALTGTIPATGNLARYTFSNGTGIGGLEINNDYYIIKLSSSTFSLATTKENAINGVAISITDDTDTSYFNMYELVDYGTSFYDDGGAVLKTGENTQQYRDIITGGDFYTTALANNDSLCIVVPYLENRAQIISPKVFSNNVEDNTQKIYIRYAPLGENDEIRIKFRNEDVFGLPISSPNIQGTDFATWTGNKEFYTETDLSVAKTYLDAGNELEIEFVAGVGAGQCVKINSIDEDSDVYSLVLDESVIGASPSLKSYFIIHNWKEIGTIDNSRNSIGYEEFPVGKAGKFLQAKFELIGSDIKIEDIQILNTKQK